MKGLSPIHRKYKYLGKIIKALIKIKVDSDPEKMFFNKDIVLGIESCQLLYCMYQSDEYFMKKSFDTELYELDILIDEFYEIYYEMRTSNMIKTNYLFSRLLKKAENTLSTFLKRFPLLYKMYLKRDPNSGEGYIEL